MLWSLSVQLETLIPITEILLWRGIFPALLTCSQQNVTVIACAAFTLEVHYYPLLRYGPLVKGVHLEGFSDATVDLIARPLGIAGSIEVSPPGRPYVEPISRRL